MKREETGDPGEKIFEAQKRTNKQLYSHTILNSAGLKPGLLWGKATPLGHLGASQNQFYN